MLNQVAMPGAYGHGASALAVPNERWQEVVSDLVGKAEMIVAEVPVLTPGAQFELETGVEKGRIGQTVVTIPSPGARFLCWTTRRRSSNSLECCGTTNCRPWEPKTTSYFAT
jgi:hypothetical protein